MRHIPYLKGLDVLRFFAAALVVLTHAHYHLSQLHIPWHDTGTIMHLGQPAVAFFFTLSGVLLTCLGIQEQRLHGRIDVKKFYYRRVLRIWPLYYAVVAFSLLFIFVLLPVFYPSAENRFPMPVSLLCLLFLVPNHLAINGVTSFGAVNGLWSIGVEELFYLLFPFLLLLHKKGRSYVFIFGAALIVHLIIYIPLLYSAVFSPPIKRFLCTYAFQYMLVGCVFAAVWMECRENKKRLRWFNIFTGLSVLGAVMFLTRWNTLHISVLTSLVKSVLFSALILFAAQVDNRVFKNNPLVYFGKISYGIYVFHPFVSYGLRFLCAHQPRLVQLFRQMPSLYFILLLACTIVVAHFSYRFYERRFLRLKERAEPAQR